MSAKDQIGFNPGLCAPTSTSRGESSRQSSSDSAASGAAPAPGKRDDSAHSDPVQGATPSKLSFAMLTALGAAAAGFLICAIVSAILISHARNAVREETDQAFLLATAAATFQLPTSFGRENAVVQARRFASEIDALRHVTARLDDAQGRPVTLDPPQVAAPAPVPGWLTRLLSPPPRSEIFPIRHYPNVVGIVTISNDPSDEIAKTWESLRVILLLLVMAVLVMGAITMAITLFVTRRLGQFHQVMQQMQANDLNVRAPDSALRELSHLSNGINALAAHLRQGRSENQQLQERMMTLAESERARIASDLHDDMGPLLFALSAAAGQARQSAKRLANPQDGASLALGESLDAVTRHAQAVQRSARSAIEDLQPITIDDATLDELLHELVLSFGEMAPEIDLALDADPHAQSSQAAEIAIYRFVRESVLNAIRHANPSQIRIELFQQSQPQPRLVARVCDNGTGPTPGRRTGLGQSGMEERAQMLGAVYHPPIRKNDQTVTEFWMPL